MSRKRKSGSADGEMTEVSQATADAEANGKAKKPREVIYLLLGTRTGQNLLTLIREFRTRFQVQKYLTEIGPVLSEMYSDLRVFKGKPVALFDEVPEVPA